MSVIVFDIGGTAVKGGIFLQGRYEGDYLIETFCFPTDAKRGAEAVIDDVMKAIEKEMKTDPDIEAIGISTTGQVDEDRGTILYANENMPGYTGMDIRIMMYERFHLRCEVENDVICAAIGEYDYGNARDESDFLYLTIGTGIGAALFLDDMPYYGAGSNRGLYAGYMFVNAHGKPVPFEQVASTTALVREAMKIDASLTNGKAVLASENPKVKKVIDDWCSTVAMGIAGMIHLYNVPLVILGGGIMENESVFKTVSSLIRQYVVPVFKDIRIQKPGLGNKAGLYGAYSLAKMHIGF